MRCAIEVSEKILAVHDSYRQLFRDRWEDTVEKLSPIVRAMMVEAKTDNPLDAILPHCEEMHARGADPSILIALAADIVLAGPEDLR